MTSMTDTHTVDPTGILSNHINVLKTGFVAFAKGLKICGGFGVRPPVADNKKRLNA